MSLLDTLRSLLGFGSSPQRSMDQRDVEVTVEHEPGAEPRVETESAVKGAEVTGGGESERGGGPQTDRRAETGERATDDSRVEIPDAEGRDSAGESVEPPSEDEPVEIPDAEELAGVDEPEAEETEPEPGADVEAAEPDAEAAEVEPEAADEPTDTIKGIGSTYADRLANAGIETVGDLAAADPADAAEEADVSESRLERWVERARNQ